MADGTITLKAESDDKGVKVGMRDIEASVKRMSTSVEGLGEKAKIAIQKQLDSLSKLNNQYVQQEQKVNDLKQRMKELSDQKIETDKYKRLSDEIKKLEDEFEKVETKQREWLDMGFSINSVPLKELDKQMDDIWADIDKIQQKQAEMRNSGTAYVDPRSLSEYQNTASRLTVEEMRLDDMNNRLNTSFASTEMRLKECSEEAVKSSSKFNGLASAAKRFSGRLIQSGITGMKRKVHELWQALDKLMAKFMQLASGAITGGLQKISNGIFAIHKSANKSTLSLKNLLKYAFGIRSLFVLFNKMRSAVVDGIQNLAKYDLATKTGDVNNCLSALMSSLTQLKNSFATAFAPIITVVTPLLVNFINMISQAVTRVGMLIAALTGQNTFTKAVAVQENYAASLDKTANKAKKAAKELKGYLSPIDEINRYDDGKTNSNTGSNGKYTGPSPKDMFEEVPIESSLKGIADKIRELIKNEDWEGLGAYIASGINKGLQKIYDVINWNNVGPKVTKFCDAFTRTFNSLVDNIDWDLMGRTVGAGINTLVNTLNLLIAGIDWKNLGKKFATGITGLVREVNWNNLGQLMGNKFMIAWKIFNGMVHNLPYSEIGKAVAECLNGAMSQISLSEVADTLATGLNGAFTSLYSFSESFDWSELVDNIANGINTFVSEFKWEENGQKLEVFLDDLCKALLNIAEKTNWESFGAGIGTFISQVDWVGHLKQVISAIVKALGGLFDGMEAGGTAGKVVSFLSKVFLAVKIADITGLDSLIKLLVGFLGKKLIGSETVAELSGSLTTLLGNSVKGAAGGFSSLASSIAPLVGTAGLIVGVGVAAATATSELAKMVETMQGGNGIGGTFGNTMDDFIQTLQRRGDIISGSATEIWDLKESLEKEGMTAEEKSSATQKLIDKLGEMGVTSEQATQAFETLRQKGLITDDMFDILSESIKTLGNDTTNMAGQINLGSQSAQKSYDDLKLAIGNLTNQMHLGTDEQGQLLNALDRTVDSGGTAQDAYNNVMAAVKNMGGNTETAAKIFSEVFPNAVQVTKSSVDKNIIGAQQTVTTSTGKMKADAETNLAGLQKAAENASGGVNTATVKNWGNSASEVDKNLDQMKQHANLKLGEMQKTVDSHFSSQYNTMTTKWQKANERINQIIADMAAMINNKKENLVSSMERAGSRMGNGLSRGVSEGTSGVKRALNNAVSKVNSTIGNINSALSGIEHGFTFSYDVQLPTGGRRWGNYSLNLPRVNTVPYLATGAVIPPRSEFLAVLGDQKNGRNLEAPESLIRQIFREETGSSQGSNTYNVSVSASGRKFLDIVLEEGELRRNRNGGKNPFKLDD